MLEFTCWSCDEKFKVSLENLYNKISIQCYNCDNPMPQDAISSLRALSESYMDVVDTFYKTNTPDKAWGISICKTEKVIPDKPDDFLYQRPSPESSFWRHRNKPYKLTTQDSNAISDDDCPF